MADRLVCRDCHRVLEVDDGEQCPSCGSTSMTEDWAGYVVVAHPEDSRIAEEMGISEPGRYALKVR
ncbi:transcription elongation factor Spt4 [Natronomonas pharaonis DSM 2160]|uniref:Transcription elongation factor Spt4 n=1 Tax=Natronomonas pharaonis (strain ATCC 35678 / DSM 2160 / CIP 103997 / JCM 8858 / NBRC 14720 / NCIMB 2260 / Gabara) TaxID=348780 RepID=A0A1U7EZB1_NATPD|nr:transcription elongation factor subunit Spt4 [Natronomonas pharaonis]CAI50630.1 transcription elongation factor Spt4 [Natronomonas pharaonis DSM 2160]